MMKDLLNETYDEEKDSVIDSLEYITDRKLLGIQWYPMAFFAIGNNVATFFQAL